MTASNPSPASPEASSPVAAHEGKPNRATTPVTDELTAARAAGMAAQLLAASLKSRRPAERRQARRMAGLINDPAAKNLSMIMTDRLIRSRDPVRSAAGWRAVLERCGLPRGFSFADRLLLRIGAAASKLVPAMVMKAVRRRLRRDSSGVILPAEPGHLTSYLNSRRASGIRANVNQLGEAVLGEGEATHRLTAILNLLERLDVNYVSVKLSAIFSQIHPAAFDATLAMVKERLRVLYRAALPWDKFINLDMEEYRDLALTTTAFREVLDEPGFERVRAGIVLQAYLPDSHEALRGLTEWAQRRVAAGGAPIKVRLVKGANLAMEAVDAELHGWNPAPYGSKAETDASFRRLLDFACRPEHTAAVRLGVASHNLFDVALALVLRDQRGLGQNIEIEMLEGMANHQARAVSAAAGGLLAYAPVVAEKDFGAALAYLIRRLDENTSPGNFLSGLFSFTPDSPPWQDQQRQFLSGWAGRHTVSTESRRAQPAPRKTSGFTNEPDTDFTLEANRARLTLEAPAWLPPLPPPCGPREIDEALASTAAARPAWELSGDASRADVLRRCAAAIAEARFEIMALLRTEGRKAIMDADAEISEAVDFARYYAETGLTPAGGTAQALGTVVVTPPWNFPFAIPCGGVLAALMAGNSVILKPAPETVRTGWLLANLLWKAGVPREVLQFVSCDDGETGRRLITDPRTSAVILTGAWETARLFLDWRPSLTLFAETSGKNALVVSALADRDLAIRDLVRSAFGHAGQKCSAASLAILEAEVYDDPDFRRQLRDAASSLKVGPATDPAAVVTPLIRAPGDHLLRALTTLENGEEWLLEPVRHAGDPCLWSPGIKLGVQPDSWFHRTECFGPVLGLMRARDLDEAIRFQNATDYGLTAGLHSLDEGEIERWREQVQAGNLYINRPITGAIVQRQPFGGWKRSSIGPGAKAGGPNYVHLLRRFTDRQPLNAETAAAGFREAWQQHFSRGNDPSGLRCERNTFRYRPCRGVVLRLEAPDPAVENTARAAALVCRTSLTVSYATSESDADFAARLPELTTGAEFLRSASPLPESVLRAATAAGLNRIEAPVSACAAIELPRWLREQSVSETRHRYGNPLPD